MTFLFALEQRKECKMKNIYLPIFIKKPYLKSQLLRPFQDEIYLSDEKLRVDINRSPLNKDISKKFNVNIMYYERADTPFVKLMVKEKPNFIVSKDEISEMTSLLEQMLKNQDIFTEPYILKM